MRPDVPERIKLTRGATFRHSFTLPARVDVYTGMSAQVRDTDGELLADLDVRPIDDTAKVEVSAPAEATASWPTPPLSRPNAITCVFSLRVMIGGEVAHVDTKYLQILPEVTSNG